MVIFVFDWYTHTYSSLRSIYFVELMLMLAVAIATLSMHTHTYSITLLS